MNEISRNPKLVRSGTDSGESAVVTGPTTGQPGQQEEGGAKGDRTGDSQQDITQPSRLKRMTG
jgi:hypothetical protein